METLVFYLILNVAGIGTNYFGPYTAEECKARYDSLAQFHKWAKEIRCQRAIGYRTCNRSDAGEMVNVCPIFD
jgi:hypothetical protein